MKDIAQLQNVVLDREKLSGLVKQTEKEFLKQVLQIKDSQVSNLRHGTRRPNADGLLRLMLLYGIKAEEITTLKNV